MSRWMLHAGIGLVLGVGVSWFWRPNFPALERERTALNDSVTALQGRLRARETVDQARVDSLARARAVISAAAQTAHHARNATQQAQAALDSALAGNTALLAIVDTLEASYGRAFAADSVQLAAFAGVVAQQDRRIAARDSSIQELRTNLVAALSQRDHWRRAARAPLLLRLATTAGTITATALLCRAIPGDGPC